MDRPLRRVFLTRKTKNILFIMFDQLRWDYLSCAGHKALETPHMDSLASQGVRFSRTYVHRRFVARQG